MTYDPNWFYSSLSQCAAALIGLLGAILATRIQQQHEAARSSYQGVREQLEHLNSLLQTRLDEVRSFLAFAEVRIREVEMALKKGDRRLNVGLDKMMFGGDGYGPREIDVSGDLVTNYRDAMNHARRMQDLLAKHEKSQTVKRAFRLATDMPKLRAMFSQVPAVLPLYTLSEEDMEQFSYYFEVTLNELRQRYSAHVGGTASIRVPAVLTFILGWLSVFGLLWPLAYLYAYDGTSKTALLLAFGMGVVAIPLFIGWEIFRIWQMQNVKLPNSAT